MHIIILRVITTVTVICAHTLITVMFGINNPEVVEDVSSKNGERVCVRRILLAKIYVICNILIVE